MNKQMIVCALGIVALSSSMAFAALTAPGGGVVGSAHDMRTYNSITEAENRVCAFCHTPHHAITADNDYLPLWSHTLPTTNYTAYDSATIDSTITGNMMEGPSKLCMSCHDGAIAVDTHYESGNSGEQRLTSDAWGEAGIGQVSTLANDHPIGFEYDAVANGPIAAGQDPSDNAANADGKDNWIRKSGASYLDNLSLKVGDRLHVNTQGKKIMTCATCHDVHNKKNKADSGAVKNYFLLSPNAGSKLCLTCHIK